VTAASVVVMAAALLESTDENDDNGIDDVAVLAQLAGLEPCALSIMVLTGIDPLALDLAGRFAYAEQWDRQLSWITAENQRALAATMVVDESMAPQQMCDELDDRSDLVAATLNRSTASAGARLSTAMHLVEKLPATCTLLAAGEISFRHAAIIADATGCLEAETVARFEARVLARAPQQTPADFGRRVRRAILAVAPEAAQLNHESAVAERNVRRRCGSDGMGELVATLPAADVETVYLALDAVARNMAAADGDTPMPIDARRADVLVGWALQALADPQLPKQHGRPVAIRVTLDLPTALGLADNPATLGSYGVSPGHVARALAADADWRRFLLEPLTGALLDFGQAVYRPPQLLRDYLIARDRTCRFPGCSVGAESTDIDHGVPYEKGGSTSSCTCHHLCRRHHRLKTVGGWKVLCHGDGAVTWIAPTGQRFFVPTPSMIRRVNQASRSGRSPSAGHLERAPRREQQHGYSHQTQSRELPGADLDVPCLASLAPKQRRQ
jgi:hypothetical protein